MRETFRLGRIDGIAITANWTLLVTVTLITYSLAIGVFPETIPDQTPLAYWVTAVLVTPLFFASLVAHEMGHSLVARRKGVEVKEITLWLFGGVSKLESDCPSGKDELQIAVVGPAVSVGLAFAWGTLAVIVDVAGGPSLVAGGLAWLAAVNLMLGIFNLLPAFPLDGGRVLRALLWMRVGDRVAATAKAAVVSQVLSTLLIVLGIMEFLGTGSIGGLWLAFLGWFVMQAGRAETSAVTQHELLGGISIGAIMSTPVLTAPADIPVDLFVDRYVLGSRHSAYPVTDARGQVVGLITLDQLRQVPAAQRSATAVGAVALPLASVATVGVDDAVIDVIPAMGAAATGRALVFRTSDAVGEVRGDSLLTDRSAGALAGIVTWADIARTLEVRALADGVPA